MVEPAYLVMTAMLKTTLIAMRILMVIKKALSATVMALVKMLTITMTMAMTMVMMMATMPMTMVTVMVGFIKIKMTSCPFGATVMIIAKLMVKMAVTVLIFLWGQKVLYQNLNWPRCGPIHSTPPPLTIYFSSSSAVAFSPFCFSSE